MTNPTPPINEHFPIESNPIPELSIATGSVETSPDSDDLPQTEPVSGTPQIIINLPRDEETAKAADILHGVAAVLWPLIIGFSLFLFREQIASLSRRLRKGSAFGAEAEFDKELEALNREVNKAKEETGAKQDADGTNNVRSPISNETELLSADQADNLRRDVLAESARSPRLGLMLLTAEIDKLARRISASTGHHERHSLREQLDFWGAQLPPHVSAAYRLFSHVRNRIVHGRDASEAEILSAIDSGLELYEALGSISVEENVVAHAGVEIFGDPNCRQRLEGVGLIMETTFQGEKTLRIYPTTQMHFRVGMRLTWEWNLSRVWGKAWYRDPVTGEVKQAWDSSAEFIGKDLDLV